MWVDYAHGLEGLEKIYEGKSFGDIVELRRVLFEGRNTRIDFDLKIWPDNPPEKWVSNKYNTVQVSLILGYCDEVHLKDWAMKNVGELRVKELGANIYSFKFISSSGAYFSCTCDSLIISKISSYQNA